MIPIVAFNYGAQRPDRMKKTVRLSVIYAVAVMIVGLVVFQVIPDKLLLLFNADEEMLTVGCRALRIISLSYVFAGYGIVVSAVLQSLGHGFKSMCISLIRQIAVLLPLAFIFSRTGDVGTVWFAFPAAEIVSVITCTVFFLYIRKRYFVTEEIAEE